MITKNKKHNWARSSLNYTLVKSINKLKYDTRSNFLLSAQGLNRYISSVYQKQINA